MSIAITVGLLALMTVSVVLVSCQDDIDHAPEAGQLASVHHKTTGTITVRTALHQQPPVHGSTPKPRYGRALLEVGEEWNIVGRNEAGDWLYVFWGWIPRNSIALHSVTVDDLQVVISGGLWLVSPSLPSNQVLVTEDARWNSWQWDPQGGSIWYQHVEAVPSASRYWGSAPVSKYNVDGNTVRREHSRLGGDVLAAPVGGAVLVRSRDWETWPIGRVFILDADGTVHQIGSQCWVVFSDAYHAFGNHAAWSPDGRHVVLRNSPSEPDPENVQCRLPGTTIYDRDGVVEPNLVDRDDPYRQDWYRNPNFSDQVAMDEVCEDRPPGVALSEQRNHCAWSPDRQWFAMMPGAADNPHLGELLIYAADGQLSRRFLVPGWPCNMFQWSPDSQWLAYGGPSGCA